MDILIYILELIKFRKEVGIVGLGTFYKEKKPGSYDAENHTFLPPSHTLSFSQTVKETNNLTTHISKKRHVSPDTANYFIEQYVNEINKALAENGEYDLQNLGKLILSGQEIKFEPATDINVGFDFFALPPVTTNISQSFNETTNEEINVVATQENDTQNVPVIETVEEEFVDHEPIVTEESTTNTSEQEITTLAETQEETPTTLAQEPTLASTDLREEESIIEENRFEEENPGQFINIETPEQPENELENLQAYLDSARKKPEDIAPVENVQIADKPAIFEEAVTNTTIEKEEKKGISSFIKLLLALLIIAAAAILLYFINPDIFGPFIKSNRAENKLPVPIKEENQLKTQADSLSFADSIMKNAEKVGLKVDQAKDTLKVTTTTKPINTTTYEVIAAALTTKEAVPFIARLKKVGIVANIVEDMPGKLKKVSIGSFNHPDSAQKYAAEYRKKLKNPQIYAIPVKHK